MGSGLEKAYQKLDDDVAKNILTHYSREKYREINFNPIYRPISYYEPDEGVTLIQKLIKPFTYGCIKRIKKELTVKEKESIIKAKLGEYEVEKTKDDERILLNFNTVNPFEKIFIENKEIQDDLLKKDLARFSEISSMWEGKMHFPLEDILTNKIPYKDIERPKDLSCLRYDKDISRYWEDKLYKTNIVKNLFTFPYKMMFETARGDLERWWKEANTPSEYANEEFYIKTLQDEFNTSICGKVNLNNYPNEKITVFHALHIDCDLMNTFNIHLKDLDPLSFQFIKLDYFDEGNINKFSLEGPINYN